VAINRTPAILAALPYLFAVGRVNAVAAPYVEPPLRVEWRALMAWAIQSAF